jgi:hypothetical protein
MPSLHKEQQLITIPENVFSLAKRFMTFCGGSMYLLEQSWYDMALLGTYLFRTNSYHGLCFWIEWSKLMIEYMGFIPSYMIRCGNLVRTCRLMYTRILMFNARTIAFRGLGVTDGNGNEFYQTNYLGFNLIGTEDNLFLNMIFFRWRNLVLSKMTWFPFRDGRFVNVYPVLDGLMESQRKVIYTPSMGKAPLRCDFNYNEFKCTPHVNFIQKGDCIIGRVNKVVRKIETQPQNFEKDCSSLYKEDGTTKKTSKKLYIAPNRTWLPDLNRGRIKSNDVHPKKQVDVATVRKLTGQILRDVAWSESDLSQEDPIEKFCKRQSSEVGTEPSTKGSVEDSVEPVFKMIFMANHIPSLPECDKSIWQKIPEEEEDSLWRNILPTEKKT